MRSDGILKIDVLKGLKQIETASQDLIIADPPYFQIVKNKWDNNWENETDYLNWCGLWIKECFRVLKDNGTFYLWGGIGKHKEHPLFKQIILSEEVGFIFQDWITWKKQKGLGSKKGFMFIREELIYFTKTNIFTCNTPYLDEVAKNHGRLSKQKVNYKRCGNVWTDINEVTVGNLIHTERVKHPTQKPLKACFRIIETSSNENDKVLIPFAGSGSEIVACEELKRNWTAFEIEDSYIEIINKRLNKYKKMKTAEEILKQKEEIAQIQGIDFSVIIFNNAIKAMEEYAQQYIDKIQYLESVICDMENGR